MLSKHGVFTKSATHSGGSNKKRKGRLFVISASSGTGKTTLARELLRRDHNLVQSISVTTRAPRGSELNERDYYFVTKQAFQRLRQKNGFLEWANVFGNHYGTPRRVVEAYLRKGKDVLLLIDVQGAKQVKKMRPDAVFIFLTPPSKAELRRRLKKRGTDPWREITKRMRVATRELVELNDPELCDYRIVNRDIPVARRVLEAIIDAERKKR